MNALQIQRCLLTGRRKHQTVCVMVVTTGRTAGNALRVKQASTGSEERLLLAARSVQLENTCQRWLTMQLLTASTVRQASTRQAQEWPQKTPARIALRVNILRFRVHKP